MIFLLFQFFYNRYRVFEIRLQYNCADQKNKMHINSTNHVWVAIACSLPNIYYNIVCVICRTQVSTSGCAVGTYTVLYYNIT